MLKNLLKKLCVMCTAATLLLSCIGAPSVFAAAKTETVAEINGWKLIMYSDNESFHQTFKDECSISVVSDGGVINGEHSVKIVYPKKPGTSTAAYWLGLSAQSIGILEPGKYTLSYSIRSVDADENALDNSTAYDKGARTMYAGSHIPLLNGSTASQSINNGAYIAMDAVKDETTGKYPTTGADTLTFSSNNTTKVTRTTTIRETGSGAYRTTAPSATVIDNFFTIKFNKPFSAIPNTATAAIYIDDISLTRDGSDENLLVNGSFENNNIQNPVYGKKAVVADTAVGTKGNVALTWKNPSEPLKSVALYDITDGTETAVDGFTQNLTAGAKNSVDLTNVAKERRYYKVVNTFTDGTVSEFILSADASEGSREISLINGWTAKDNKENGYINKTVADIDTNIKHGGNSSLHIRSGRSVYKDSEKLDVFQTLPALDSHVTNGGYYKMSMWVKKNNSAAFFTRINNQPFPGWKVDGSANNFYLIQLNKDATAQSHGWQYFEYVFSPKNDTSLGLASSWTADKAFNWTISQFNTADDVWIDDVSFVKCDADGKTLDGAENLITNGGFEFDETERVTGFTESDVTLTPADGEITVSYPAITKGEKVNIYFTDDDGIKEFKGSLYEDKTAFTFKNLVNKKEYEITVAKASAVTGVEQEEPVVLTSSPVPPAVVLGEYVLSNADGIAPDAKTPGIYSIKVNVANNTYDEGYKAVLIYAVYDAENKMIDFNFDEQTIAVDTNKDLEVKDIEINDGYVLKAFLWNGFDTIKPLKQFKNFSE